MLKTIFPTIISVPRVYNVLLHHAIDYADHLDVAIDDEELQELLKTYPESLEIRCVHLESLLANAKEQEEAVLVHEQIREMVAEHPDNLRCKMVEFYSEMEKNPDMETTALFEQVFDKEIAALLYDKPYPVVVPDAILLWMMKLMMTHCVETKNKAGVEKMFLMIRSMQWYDEVEELSLIAFGEDTFQDEIDEDHIEVHEWHNRISEIDIWTDINIKPHFDIFYKILNRPIKDFTDEDAAAVINIENREKLAHDIRWLLDQGCLRTLQLNGKGNFDFILQATYLIAHFKLKELAPLVTRILTGVPDIIFDYIAGDFSGEVLLPWIYSLGNMDLEGWMEMLSFKDEDEDESMDCYWHSKNIWLNAIVKISAESGPQSERANQLLDKVWTSYEKSNYECLGWLMYYIVSYRIDSYDDRIKEAFKNDLIDQFTHGTFEEAMSDKDRVTGFFAESHTPESIGDDYQEIIKYVRKLETEYQASSADTVAEEMEYFRKNADNRSDFGEFLDNYDTEDGDGKLSAIELAILGMLDDDDNSYSPDTTATIIPIKRDGPKVGRNDPCPCGSGKKYKKCCL